MIKIELDTYAGLGALLINTIVTGILYIFMSIFLDRWFPLPVSISPWLLTVRDLIFFSVFVHGFFSTRNLDYSWNYLSVLVGLCLVPLIGLQWWCGAFQIQNTFYIPFWLALDWFLATFSVWIYLQ